MKPTGPVLARGHGGSMQTSRTAGWPRPLDDGAPAGATCQASRQTGQHRTGDPDHESETGGPFSIANLSLVTNRPRPDGPPAPVGPVRPVGPVGPVSLPGGLTIPIPPDAFRPQGDMSERPTAAGVFDALFGGTAHRRVDRRCALAILLAWPDAPVAIRVMREFQVRSVQFAARNGVDQFLVLGSGPRTIDPVHEIACSVAPGSQTVYVESDPLAADRMRPDVPDGQFAIARADLTRPSDVLRCPDVRARLDGNRPIAVVMVPGLSELGGHEDSREVLRGYRAVTARGSLLIFSQVCDEGSARGLRALFERAGQPGSPRSHQQTVEMVSTWEPIEPGLVPAEEWHAPDERARPHSGRHPVYASVGWH